MRPYRIAVAAASALLVTALAAPASASTPSVHRFGPVHLGGHVGFVHGKNVDGGNWSGYAVHASGFHAVVANWVEPQVTCNSNRDLFAPWVGIDGYGSSTVEQTGVATDCSSGHPEYAGWYEMYPAAPVYYANAVAAGDHFTARVSRNASTYTLTLTNHTKGWTKRTTKSLSTARNVSAEVIMESPTAAYPDFGRVNFTGARVDGATLASVRPTALDASNSHGFEDHTSAITNGTRFHIDYLRE
jgi:hypothetical protein